MFKRVGVLAFVLTAGAMFLQPVAAFAADRHEGGRATVQYRDNARRVERFREPVRRDGRDHSWDRVARRDERVIVTAPAPYYYAPAPNCR